MQFQGGKARQAKAIGQLLKTVDRPCYLEPFVGGAWVLKEVAQHFQKVTASDLHLDLVLLYQALQEGWEPPSEVSEDEWRRQRRAEPSALRAFVGYGTSFGGRWFEGYARNGHSNYAAVSQRSLMKKAAVIQNTAFGWCDYAQHQPGESDLVYCDPPYIGTKHLTQLPRFDHHRFWHTMESWVAAGATVFVSERTAPEGWRPVLTQQRQTSLGLDNQKQLHADILFTREP
jgi:DNA adenine methylase